MIGIQAMKARSVFGEVAVGTTTAATVQWLIVTTATRTTVATLSGFALQEASKVFEFLEFGIWEILSV